CIYRDNTFGCDVLAGFRYVDLAEHISIGSQSVSLPGSTFLFDNVEFDGAGNVFIRGDEFATHNRFYGGQIGAQVDYRWCGLFVNVLGKVAVGDNHEKVSIGGFSQVTGAGGGAAMTLPSGLFAVSSNSGVFQRDEFAVIPELRVRLGYQFNHFVS